MRRGISKSGGRGSGLAGVKWPHASPGYVEGVISETDSLGRGQVFQQDAGYAPM